VIKTHRFTVKNNHFYTKNTQFYRKNTSKTPFSNQKTPFSYQKTIFILKKTTIFLIYHHLYIKKIPFLYRKPPQKHHFYSKNTSKTTFSYQTPFSYQKKPATNPPKRPISRAWAAAARLEAGETENELVFHRKIGVFHRKMGVFGIKMGKNRYKMGKNWLENG
jgi:hypothetical protein